MFKLHIAISCASIDALKLDLTKYLPEVKSSHRCEALARALGFRTYAALLAATETMALADRREADGVVFAAYLAEHGFIVDTAVFHRAVGRIVIDEVLAAEPLLNIEGYGAGDWQRNNGIRETASDRASRIANGRSKLTSHRCVAEFLQALAFVSRIAPIKLNNAKASSYGLKHIAEKMPSNYPEGQPLGPHYVSNGAMIVAAIHAGFRYMTYEGVGGLPSRSVSFNMSERSISQLRGALAA